MTFMKTIMCLHSRLLMYSNQIIASLLPFDHITDYQGNDCGSANIYTLQQDNGPNNVNVYTLYQNQGPNNVVKDRV